MWYDTKCCYCGCDIRVYIHPKFVRLNRRVLLGNACNDCIPENSAARNGIDESAYPIMKR